MSAAASSAEMIETPPVLNFEEIDYKEIEVEEVSGGERGLSPRRGLGEGPAPSGAGRSRPPSRRPPAAGEPRWESGGSPRAPKRRTKRAGCRGAACCQPPRGSGDGKVSPPVVGWVVRAVVKGLHGRELRALVCPGKPSFSASLLSPPSCHRPESLCI